MKRMNVRKVEWTAVVIAAGAEMEAGGTLCWHGPRGVVALSSGPRAADPSFAPESFKHTVAMLPPTMPAPTHVRVPSVAMAEALRAAYPRLNVEVDPV